MGWEIDPETGEDVYVGDSDVDRPESQEMSKEEYESKKETAEEEGYGYGLEVDEETGEVVEKDKDSATEVRATEETKEQAKEGAPTYVAESHGEGTPSKKTQEQIEAAKEAARKGKSKAEMERYVRKKTGTSTVRAGAYSAYGKAQEIHPAKEQKKEIERKIEEVKKAKKGARYKVGDKTVSKSEAIKELKEEKKKAEKNIEEIKEYQKAPQLLAFPSLKNVESRGAHGRSNLPEQRAAAGFKEKDVSHKRRKEVTQEWREEVEKRGAENIPYEDVKAHQVRYQAAEQLDMLASSKRRTKRLLREVRAKKKKLRGAKKGKYVNREEILSQLSAQEETLEQELEKFEKGEYRASKDVALRIFEKPDKYVGKGNEVYGVEMPEKEWEKVTKEEKAERLEEKNIFTQSAHILASSQYSERIGEQVREQYGEPAGTAAETLTGIVPKTHGAIEQTAKAAGKASPVPYTEEAVRGASMPITFPLTVGEAGGFAIVRTAGGITESVKEGSLEGVTKVGEEVATAGETAGKSLYSRATKEPVGMGVEIAAGVGTAYGAGKAYSYAKPKVKSAASKVGSKVKTKAYAAGRKIKTKVNKKLFGGKTPYGYTKGGKPILKISKTGKIYKRGWLKGKLDLRSQSKRTAAFRARAKKGKFRTKSYNFKNLKSKVKQKLGIKTNKPMVSKKVLKDYQKIFKKSLKQKAKQSKVSRKGLKDFLFRKTKKGKHSGKKIPKGYKEVKDSQGRIQLQKTKQKVKTKTKPEKVKLIEVTKQGAKKKLVSKQKAKQLLKKSSKAKTKTKTFIPTLELMKVNQDQLQKLKQKQLSIEEYSESVGELLGKQKAKQKLKQKEKVRQKYLTKQELREIQKIKKKQKGKQKPKLSQIMKQAQKQKQKQELTQGQKQRLKLKKIQGLKQAQDLKLKQKQAQDIKLQKLEKLNLKLDQPSKVPPKMRTGFGGSEEVKEGEEIIEDLIKGQKKEYSPSLTAKLFDIKGEKPETITGVGIRPLED